MRTHEHAGQRPLHGAPADIAHLVTRYFVERPDPDAATQRVSFGTSGHRGSSAVSSFNEAHVVAICMALIEYRRAQSITGPIFVGRDTHALSEPAFATTLEVLAAHDVTVVVDSGSRFTPTPVISHAILTHNRSSTAQSDGIVITPSHNPPEDGGFKYNPPTGGPADTSITAAVQKRANELLEHGVERVPRVAFRDAMSAANTHHIDIGEAYVRDLGNAIDVDAIAGVGLRIGADPMGGSSVDLWERIAAAHGLDIDVVNRVVDASFSFMPLDHDGRIRMDCSSPHAMAGLIALRDRYDIAFGNDPDADRHGIVTPSVGLMNPNHFLAAAMWYLFRHRDGWSGNAAVGKTLVSSSMIDRVAAHLGRRLVEVPVGFKWFVDGLLSGKLAFCGEESAGASFVKRDGSVWTTDKDGILLALLAAEMTARTDRDPGELYGDLEQQFGAPAYERIDAPATPAQKQALLSLSADSLRADELAGEKITARLTTAPGNGAAIGGLKVVTENAWFAARPSGTEDVYKIYAESFRGPEHLRQVQTAAVEFLANLL